MIRELLCCLCVVVANVHADQTRVSMGKGHYATQLRPGGEREPPPARWDRQRQGPVPTNQWYSSLLFSEHGQPLYVQPASYRATSRGWEVDVPIKQIQESLAREENDITFPHRSGLLIVPGTATALEPFLTQVSDWAIDVALRPKGQAADVMRVTVARGSPYSYYQLSESRVVFHLDPATASQWPQPGIGARHITVQVRDQTYGLYVPEGSTWTRRSPEELQLELPDGATFFTLAALPDAKPQTHELFSRYAFNFIEKTRVHARYDEAGSALTTQFSIQLKPMLPGPEGTLIALYPHHWHNNPALDTERMLPLSYHTVRGTLKLMQGKGFETRYTHHGLMPVWPGLTNPKQRAQLDGYLKQDTEFGAQDLLNNRKAGTYWEGKGLNRAAQVMAIAHQQGQHARRDDIRRAIQQRFEKWFAPEEGAAHYFFNNQTLGTLIGYPDEYGSAQELNDHHFHYGYWIMAAAQVALLDPQWAAASQWGSMVEALISDIAHPVRDPAAQAPKLRHFDAFEGHSWASGVANFYDGNNQESSSEAINAWAALVLWGDITGNKTIRDTGLYLYVTEIQAAHHYWFNRYKTVFEPEYTNTAAGIVWGNKYVHTTWFSENPRHVHGINLLPITTASVYLADDTVNASRKLNAMAKEFRTFMDNEGKSSPDVWQDIFSSYLALSDPQAGLQSWNPKGPVEDGETRSHTYHWLQSLVNMGVPDTVVTADTALYGVFRTAQGRRTYLAYNSGTTPKNVRFSDGTRLRVAARSLGQVSASVAQ